MNKPKPDDANRPSEQMIRDRLRNRRSLYELEKASGSSIQRLGRRFLDEREDVSRAAPAWQRYPLRAFAATAAGSAVLLAVGAFLFDGVDVAKKVENSIAMSDEMIGRVAAFLVDEDAPTAIVPRGPETSVASEAGSDNEDAARTIIATTAAEPLKPTTIAVPPVSSREELPALPSGEEPLKAEEVATSPVSGDDQPVDPVAGGANVDESLTTASIAATKAEPETISKPATETLPPRMPVRTDPVSEVRSDATEKQNPVDRAESKPAEIPSSSTIDAPAEPAAGPKVQPASSAELVPLPATNPRSGAPNEATAETIETAAVSSTGSASASSLGFARTFVNMRQSPEMESTVLTILSEGAPLMVHECDDWCRVTYQGTDGYVFGTYIRKNGADPAANAG